MDSNVDDSRVIISGASAQISDIHAAHTGVEIHSYEFTAAQANFEFSQFVRLNATTGQEANYNISLKLKND